ncbi:hypothetical protein [Burkholderia gladioli]|uniref:hypothetical protein n=1 Tax=Burkholderia gladioli TaxID=28095 RepID=UPI00163E34FB|nr:hypothetical protein [Burkholderia gladioli]
MDHMVLHKSVDVDERTDEMNKASKLGVALACAVLSQIALADCECRCVDGQVQAICSSTLDMRPMCAPQICPMRSLQMQPMTPMSMPPVGTSSCTMRQVYNPYSHQYEWQKLCQ